MWAVALDHQVILSFSWWIVDLIIPFWSWLWYTFLARFWRMMWLLGYIWCLRSLWSQHFLWCRRRIHLFWWSLSIRRVLSSRFQNICFLLWWYSEFWLPIYFDSEVLLLLICLLLDISPHLRPLFLYIPLALLSSLFFAYCLSSLLFFIYWWRWSILLNLSLFCLLLPWRCWQICLLFSVFLCQNLLFNVQYILLYLVVSIMADSHYRRIWLLFTHFGLQFGELFCFIFGSGLCAKLLLSLLFSINSFLFLVQICKSFLFGFLLFLPFPSYFLYFFLCLSSFGLFRCLSLFFSHFLLFSMFFSVCLIFSCFDLSLLQPEQFLIFLLLQMLFLNPSRYLFLSLSSSPLFLSL